MDVGTTNGWQLEDVVPAAEIVELIGAEHPLDPVAPSYPGEVANRFRYRDGDGRDRRHRLRDAAVLRRLHARAPLCRGQLFTCLFAAKGHDLREILRGRGDRRGAARVDRERLEPPLRPLLRDPDGRHGAARARRDVPHRRVTAPSTAPAPSFPSHALVAQGIEQRFPKPCVGGSSPPGGIALYAV